MNIKLIFLFGLGALSFGCHTSPKENYQQALDSSLCQMTCSLAALHSLDSTNVVQARKILLLPVFLDLDFWASADDYAKANATEEQKTELLSLAHKTLDYLLKHKEEIDPRFPDVKAGVRGLEKILTQPEDIRKLQGLADYFLQVEKKMPEVNH